MALQVQDRVKETTTTSGTGAITLAGAMTGFRAFSSVCAVGDTFYYALQAVDSNGNPTGAWETGIGTYSATNTLTRSFLASSTGSQLTLAAGTTQVWLDWSGAAIQMYRWVTAYLGKPASSVTSALDRSILNTSSTATLSGTNNITAAFTTGGGFATGLFQLQGCAYFEYTVVNGSGSNGIGVVGAHPIPGGSASGQAPGINMPNSAALIGVNVRTPAGTYASFTNSATATNGTVVGVAVNCATGKAWFRSSANPTQGWNNNTLANENPTLGVGGVSIGGSGFYPIMYNTTGVAGSATLNMGDSTFQIGDPPAGFRGMAGSTAVQTLGDAGVTSPTDQQQLVYNAAAGQWQNGSVQPTLYLGNPNYSSITSAWDTSTTNTGTGATFSGTNNNTVVPANFSQATGLFQLQGLAYFEITGDTNGMSSAGVIGTHPITGGPSSGDAIGQLANAAGFNGASMKFNSNTTYGTNFTNALLGVGYVVGIAVNCALGKMWIRSSANAGSGWNNNTLANENPALGIGGIPIGGAGTYYPAVASGGSGQTATLNMGDSAFVLGTLPAGFRGMASSTSTPAVADVGVVAPFDGQTLVYNGNAGMWENQTPNQLPGNRNAVVDGQFDSWLGGTSFALTSGAALYTADMFIATCGTGAATVSRQAVALGTNTANSPIAPTFKLRHQQTTASASVGASTVHRIEGVRSYAGQSVTLSVCLTGAAALTIPSILATQVFGTGGSPSASVTITNTVTWAVGTVEKRFSVRFDIPSIAGKTLGTAGDSLQFSLTHPAAATYTLDVSQWQIESCSPLAASDTTGVGGAPTNYDHRGYDAELARVQRFACLVVSCPGGYSGASGAGNPPIIAAVALIGNTAVSGAYIPFPRQMRAVPTVSSTLSTCRVVIGAALPGQALVLGGVSQFGASIAATLTTAPTATGAGWIDTIGVVTAFARL